MSRRRLFKKADSSRKLELFIIRWLADRTVRIKRTKRSGVGGLQPIMNKVSAVSKCRVAGLCVGRLRPTVFPKVVGVTMNDPESFILTDWDSQPIGSKRRSRRLGTVLGPVRVNPQPRPLGRGRGARTTLRDVAPALVGVTRKVVKPFISYP